MINQLQIHTCNWTDVESPNQEEIADLYKRFNLDPYIYEELPTSIERSKIRFFENYTYIVLQFPVREDVAFESVKQEIDFVFGKNFLISVRYEDIQSIKTVARDALTTPDLYNTPESIFFHIVFKQYRAIGRNLEKIDLLIEEVEKEIFAPMQQKGTVEKISLLHHKVLDYKRAMRFHADIWKQLLENSDHELFTRAQTEYLKLWNALEHYQEIIHSLQSSNDSLLSFRTNEIVKYLTLLNFIIIPIALIPTALGVTRTEAQALFVTGVLICVSIASYLYFRRKGWF